MNGHLCVETHGAAHHPAILSSDHPLASEDVLSIAQMGSLPHIAITSSGDDTRFVDDALAEHGLVRHVRAALPRSPASSSYCAAARATSTHGT